MASEAGQKTVLVIDDELGPRESLRILLKNTYRVHCADCVERGLQALSEFTPDVVIMDIRMPGINGIEGLRHLRAFDQDVAVVMLTGYGALETAQESLRLGATDYVKKPFDTNEILQIVEANIRRTEERRLRRQREAEQGRINQQLCNELAEKDHLASLSHASIELAHDLRNTMTLILGYIQVVAEQLEKRRDFTDHPLNMEEALEHVRIIEKSAQRCRMFLDLWHKMGKPEAARQPINVGTLLCDLSGEYALPVNTRGARVVLDIPTQPELLVYGEPVQLTRVFQNILGNAIDALPGQHGLIKISCAHEHNHVVVKIQDNGHGVPGGHLDKVFSPYFSSKSPDRGTGLGLAICKKTIEMAGGAIAFESTAGAGTTVTIRLPIG